MRPTELQVPVRTPLGFGLQREIIPRILVSVPSSFALWCAENRERLVKVATPADSEDLHGLASLQSTISMGIRMIGVQSLTDEDLLMIQNGEILSEAYTGIGLNNPGLYFRELARANRDGFLEPFVALEALTDFPWVRPMGSDWEQMTSTEVIHRAFVAADSVSRTLKNLAKLTQELPGSQSAVEGTWNLLLRVNSAFQRQPVAAAMIRARNQSYAESGSEGGRMVDQAIGLIHSILGRVAVDKALTSS